MRCLKKKKNYLKELVISHAKPCSEASGINAVFSQHSSPIKIFSFLFFLSRNIYTSKILIQFFFILPHIMIMHVHFSYINIFNS